MRDHRDDANDDRLDLAELSALADGTLDPARRPAVEARIAASPELRERLARERRAVAALAAVRRRERAPAGLRARIEATRTRGTRSSGGRQRPGGKRFVAAGAPGLTALAVAAAVVALALVLTLPSGTPGAPTVSEAAALATRGASMAPPPPDAVAPRSLLAAVGRLRFPNWSSTLGWRASGQRRDTIDGRRVLTVYYARAGRTVAYSIVSGPALARPAVAGTGTETGSGGYYYVQELRLGRRAVVTWRQAGHTCVLSAAGVPARVLVALVVAG